MKFIGSFVDTSPWACIIKHFTFQLDCLSLTITFNPRLKFADKAEA
jgi:hypothetical protein